MKLPPFLAKSFAGFLGIFLFLSNSVFAHSAESNLWNERRKSGQKTQLAMLLPALPSPQILGSNFRASKTSFDLSLQYGSVRKTAWPSSSKTSLGVVVHIQDVHLNSEAQSNIGRTLEELLKDHRVGLVALEGAFGAMDLTPFRAYPHQDAVKAAADYLLEQNQLSGPLHALLTSKTGSGFPRVVGVDDEAHYRLNVEAYRCAAPQAASMKLRASRQQAELERKKSDVFGPALKEFDQNVEAYRQSKISLGSYARTLLSYGNSTSLADFWEASKLESSLNFNEVERERAQLVAELVGKLNPREIEDLTNWSAAFRRESVQHDEFYSHLEALCAQHHVGLMRFPAMSAYLRYVKLSARIDVVQMLREIQVAEITAYGQLVRTREEKFLVAQSRQLFLTGKLLDFSMTKPEWDEYKTMKPLSDLAPFEKFYVEAEARDALMADNLIKELSPDSHAVLVTGGFHTDGIDQRLADAGFTVVSFVPKISKVDVDGGSAYLSVFAQQKTPLEKLFDGEKLFLSPPQQDSLLKMIGLTLDVNALLYRKDSVALLFRGFLRKQASNGFAFAVTFWHRAFLFMSFRGHATLTFIQANADLNEKILWASSYGFSFAPLQHLEHWRTAALAFLAGGFVRSISRISDLQPCFDSHDRLGSGQSLLIQFAVTTDAPFSSTDFLNDTGLEAYVRYRNWDPGEPWSGSPEMPDIKVRDLRVVGTDEHGRALVAGVADFPRPFGTLFTVWATQRDAQGRQHPPLWIAGIGENVPIFLSSSQVQDPLALMDFLELIHLLNRFWWISDNGDKHVLGILDGKSPSLSALNRLTDNDAEKMRRVLDRILNAKIADGSLAVLREHHSGEVRRIEELAWQLHLDTPEIAPFARISGISELLPILHDWPETFERVLAHPALVPEFERKGTTVFFIFDLLHFYERAGLLTTAAAAVETFCALTPKLKRRNIPRDVEQDAAWQKKLQDPALVDVLRDLRLADAVPGLFTLMYEKSKDFEILSQHPDMLKIVLSRWAQIDALQRTNPAVLARLWDVTLALIRTGAIGDGAALETFWSQLWPRFEKPAPWLEHAQHAKLIELLRKSNGKFSRDLALSDLGLAESIWELLFLCSQYEEFLEFFAVSPPLLRVALDRQAQMQAFDVWPHHTSALVLHLLRLLNDEKMISSPEEFGRIWTFFYEHLSKVSTGTESYGEDLCKLLKMPHVLERFQKSDDGLEENVRRFVMLYFSQGGHGLAERLSKNPELMMHVLHVYFGRDSVFGEDAAPHSHDGSSLLFFLQFLIDAGSVATPAQWDAAWNFFEPRFKNLNPPSIEPEAKVVTDSLVGFGAWKAAQAQGIDANEFLWDCVLLYRTVPQIFQKLKTLSPDLLVYFLGRSRNLQDLLKSGKPEDKLLVQVLEKLAVTGALKTPGGVDAVWKTFARNLLAQPLPADYKTPVFVSLLDVCFGRGYLMEDGLVAEHLWGLHELYLLDELFAVTVVNYTALVRDVLALSVEARVAMPKAHEQFGATWGGVNEGLEAGQRIEWNRFLYGHNVTLYCLEILFPGTIKHVESLLKSGLRPIRVSSLLEMKKPAMLDGKLSRAIADLLSRRRKQPRRQALNLDELRHFYTLVDIAGGFVYWGAVESAVEHLQSLDGAASLETYIKDFGRLLAGRIAAVVTGHADFTISEDVYARLPLHMVPRLAMADAHIKHNDLGSNYEKFRGLLRNLWTNTFRSWIENLRGQGPVGVEIARHNFNIRKALRRLGIDVSRWLGIARSGRVTVMPAHQFYYGEKKQKSFLIRPIERNPAGDLFIADFATVCLSMNSNQHPDAMIDRLIDEGINIVEVIDEQRHEPIAVLWLFIDTEGRVIVQNLDINATHENNLDFKNKVGEEMINYGSAFAEFIHARGYLIGAAGHGRYMTLGGFIDQRYGKHWVELPDEIKKIGGYHGEKYFLDSADRNDAYLIWERGASEFEDIAGGIAPNAFAYNLLMFVGKFRGWHNLEKNGTLKVLAWVLWVPAEVALLLFGMYRLQPWGDGWTTVFIVAFFFVDYVIGMIGNDEWRMARRYRLSFFASRMYLAWFYTYSLPFLFTFTAYSLWSIYPQLLAMQLVMDGFIFIFNHVFQNRLIHFRSTPDPSRDGMRLEGGLHRAKKMVIHVADHWIAQEIQSLQNLPLTNYSRKKRLDRLREIQEEIAELQKLHNRDSSQQAALKALKENDPYLVSGDEVKPTTEQELNDMITGLEKKTFSSPLQLFDWVATKKRLWELCRMKTLYEKAKENYLEILGIIATGLRSGSDDKPRFGPEVALRVRQQITLVGAFMETHLFIQRPFSHKYGEGMFRNSRSRRGTSWVLMKTFANLRRRKAKEMMAISLAKSVEWHGNMQEWREQGLPKAEIFELEQEFLRSINILRDETIDWIYWAGHLTKCFLDKGIRFLRHILLRSEFLFFRILMWPIEQKIKAVLNDPRFVDPETGVVYRLETKKYFTDAERRWIGLILKRLNNIAHRAMKYLDYEVALWLMQWGDYFCVVDNGVLPMDKLDTNTHVLARMQRYPEVISQLQHIHDQRIPMQFTSRFRRRIKTAPVLEILHAEQQIFLDRVIAELRSWLDTTLERQSEIVSDDRRRDEMSVDSAASTELQKETNTRRDEVISCRQQCMQLLDGIAHVLSTAPSPTFISAALAGALSHSYNNNFEASSVILNELRDVPMDLGITQANGKGALRFLSRTIAGRNLRVDDGNELLEVFRKQIRQFISLSLDKYRDYLSILYAWTEDVGSPVDLLNYLKWPDASGAELTLLVINSTVQHQWEELIKHALLYRNNHDVLAIIVTSNELFEEIEKTRLPVFLNESLEFIPRRPRRWMKLAQLEKDFVSALLFQSVRLIAPKTLRLDAEGITDKSPLAQMSIIMVDSERKATTRYMQALRDASYIARRLSESGA